MPDITELHVQREVKPKIEDVLPFYLEGAELDAANEFVFHLRSCKINLRWAGVHNFWNAKSKGKNLCYVKLGGSWLGRKQPGAEGKIKWEVILNLINLCEYEKYITDEGLQDFINEEVAATPDNNQIDW